MALDRFIRKPQKEKREEPKRLPIKEEVQQKQIKPKKEKQEIDKEERIKKFAEIEKPIEGYILDVGYDGQQAKAYLWIYDEKTQELLKWYDKSGHLPYLLSDLDKEIIQENYPQVLTHKGFAELIKIKKFDLIRDKPIIMTKVIAKDPLSIGGRQGSIRTLLKDHSWEDYIKYHKCYAYDRQIALGMPYQIEGDKLNPIHPEIPETTKTQILELFKSEKEEYLLALEEFLGFFFSPIPNLKRVAFDIEVFSTPSRIPDPNKAEEKIICASFNGTDGLKRILSLKRDDIEIGEKSPDFETDIEIFDSEKELIEETFRIFAQYPIVLTFNGDNFDLKYILNRCTKQLHFRKENVPVFMTVTAKSESAHLKNSIHIDLYKFFHNRAIKISAFRNIYNDVSLDTVGRIFLNMTKLPIQKSICELTQCELGNYCMRDSEITLNLTTFNNNLIMNLLMLLMRITRLSMEDLTRQGVSTWLQNLFYAEHRLRAFLIPNPEYIQKLKGKASTKAMIKGKKYKGAIVVKPKPGVHFNVTVLDFASLYPSVIKKWNLSYETVRCIHPECRENLIPETPHWFCTKKVGIMSLIIGLLRDLRVKYFKTAQKDKSFPEDLRNLYKIVTDSLKIIINASYGVFGSEAFPLYCLPVAEATAAIGRFAITEAQKKCEEMEIEVIYGDSIIGSRCIVIKRDGQIDVLPIEKFWNSCDEEILEINGKDVKILKNVYTISKNGEWKKVKEIIRHKTNKKLYRINQKNGETICTEDHSLITENYQKIKPNELKNNKILFLEKIKVEPCSKTVEVIDLYPLVKHFKVKSLYKGFGKVSGWKADENYIWFGWTNRSNQHKIKRFCKLSDLCKLLGIYIAEGHSSFIHGKYQYKVACGISNQNVELLKEIKEIMEQINENYKIEIIRTNKGIRRIQNYIYEDKTHRIQTNSTTWTALFASLCGSGSENKHLPSFIYNMEKRYQLLLLKYYLLGDGSIDKGGIRTFTTKSLQLVSGLCYLFKSWNIDTAVYYSDKRNVYRVRERQRALDLMHPISTKIQELPEKVRYVYDLSVEDTEVFADACGMLLLHNTDSLFLKNPNKRQIDEIVEWSERDLQIELDIDKFYRYLALSDRKKNYLGVFSDGNVDIKGLSGKKRNTPQFIQNMFLEMIEELSKVKAPEDFEVAKEQIKNKIKIAIKKLESHEYPIEDLAFQMTMSKDPDKYNKNIPQHVRAAKLLEKQLDKKVRSGDIIQFVKTKGPEGVLPVELAKHSDISIKKYKEQIESIFEQVFDALGLSFDELFGTKVRKLDAFI